MADQRIQRRVRRVGSLGKDDRSGPRAFPDDEETTQVIIVQQNQRSDSPGTIGEMRKHV